MEPRAPETHDSGSYRISSDARVAAGERERLASLARLRDPFSIAVFERIGIRDGWRCLEVGGGSGLLSRWLARRVAPSGSVLSTDVDLRFHVPPEGNLEVRQHDITRDALPAESFDLVHARAVLQHLAGREEALDRMIAATRPGGWIVAEDGDFRAMEEQERPPNFAAVSDAMTRMAQGMRAWDRYFGRRLLALFQSRGLAEVEAEGHVWTMRGRTDGAEWYVKAMEYAAPGLVAGGLVSREQAEAALREARSPDFAILSPLAVIVRGRKPA
jgi:SAM-dependent methyltransferase